MHGEGSLTTRDLDLAKLAVVHRGRLVAIAQRILGDREEAEDVAQEVLLKAEGAALRDPGALRGWLSAVCARAAIDRLRARGRRERALKGLAPRVASRGLRPDERAARRDEQAHLRGALARVDEPFRTAVELRYLEGLSFGEVARRTGALERTSRSRVARGLARLRELLGAQEALA